MQIHHVSADPKETGMGYRYFELTTELRADFITDDGEESELKIVITRKSQKIPRPKEK